MTTILSIVSLHFYCKLSIKSIFTASKAQLSFETRSEDLELIFEIHLMSNIFKRLEGPMNVGSAN